MIVQHRIESPDGFTPSRLSSAVLGVIPGVANVAGGGAGAAVSTTVQLPTTANLPANYAVVVNPGQDATWYVSSKTFDSFVVTLAPRLAANTLASGTFDVVLVA